MKKEAWMKWVKKPDDTLLKAPYQQKKAQSRKAADEACKAWWEAKEEEAEKLHEVAVRHERGGSLLKDLRFMQWGSSSVQVQACKEAGKNMTRSAMSRVVLSKGKWGNLSPHLPPPNPSDCCLPALQLHSNSLTYNSVSQNVYS